MRRRFRRISSQIFLAQLVILTTSMAVGFALFAQHARANLDYDFQTRAAAIAETVATVPDVQRCLTRPASACTSPLQDLASATAVRTGASYVVVIDMDRVRLTHPNAELIGKRVSEPIVARDGQVHLGVDSGATGVTANARVPVFGADGAVIGEVSVGLQESSVSSELLSRLPLYGVWFAIALGIGALASWLLARWMKRRTFGLELDEIARLLQEREATLHGIREGVVAIDPDGRISVVNDEARRLLRVPMDAAGRRLEDVLPEGPLRTILTAPSVGTDEIIVTDDYCLVVNRMPVTLRGRAHGAVVTLRDRTDVVGLTQELDGERSLTESLRAQQHEFSNRMHAVSGLLELGRSTAALDYLNEIRVTTADFDQTLREHIAAPQIVGLMLGKVAEANERGIDLVIAPGTRLGEAPDRIQTLTTVIGNLIDNAFDAVSRSPSPRRVEVRIVDGPDALVVAVSDSGPGVTPHARRHIFRSGFTTKTDTRERHSGLGLALVANAVARIGGSVTVSKGPGATFTVTMPRAQQESNDVVRT